MWLVKVGEQEVNLDDLPLGMWEELTTRTDQSWWTFNPLLTPLAARVTFEVAARHTGMSDDKAVAAAADLTPSSVIGLYEYKAEDDLPTEFVNGVPPVADETSTPS